jgi:hypothetical protein
MNTSARLFSFRLFNVTQAVAPPASQITYSLITGQPHPFWHPRARRGPVPLTSTAHDSESITAGQTTNLNTNTRARRDSDTELGSRNFDDSHHASGPLRYRNVPGPGPPEAPARCQMVALLRRLAATDLARRRHARPARCPGPEIMMEPARWRTAELPSVRRAPAAAGGDMSRTQGPA